LPRLAPYQGESVAHDVEFRPREHGPVALPERSAGEIAVPGQMVQPRLAGAEPRQPARDPPAVTLEIHGDLSDRSRQVDPSRRGWPRGDAVDQDRHASRGDQLTQ